MNNYYVTIEFNKNMNSLKFKGEGISGDIKDLTEEKMINLKKIIILKSNKINKNKFEIEEAYFRDIWYNNTQFKNINKIIKFNEKIEKIKKMYRPKSLTKMPNHILLSKKYN